MCTQADCAGISWKGRSGDATKASSSESFIICKSVADADLDDDEEYTTFAKQSPPSANSASSLVAQVKFQSTLAPTPGGGVLADNGATYSAKGGKTYGWNCPMKAQSMFPTEREISRGKPEAYFRNVHDRCDDGSVRTWEYKVDNGFYKVTVQHGPSQRRNINVRGTIVEGMRIHDSLVETRLIRRFGQQPWSKFGMDASRFRLTARKATNSATIMYKRLLP